MSLDATKTIFLHGKIHSEPQALLKFIAKEVGAPSVWKTFDEMSASITVHCQEFGQRYNFILSAFERFASSSSVPSTAGSQHFLYTLFELTLSLPVFALCLTERADCLDLLEKRVKSRFSQNVLYLPQPSSFDEYQMTLQNALKGSPNLASSNPSEQAYLKDIEDTFRDNKVIDRLKELFDLDHDPRPALSHFLPSLINLRSGTSTKLTMNDSIVPQSGGCGLSLAELCALTAMRRVLAKEPAEIITFDALYHEYHLGFASSAKAPEGRMLGERFNRWVVRAAVDSLVRKGWLSCSIGSTLTETIDTRQAIYWKFPMRQLPDMIGAQCTDSLYKLLTEVL